MTDKNVVVNSINIQGANRCVDIFRRPDGTFGFEEFRRDMEDNRGWFPVGSFGNQTFDSEDDALLEARAKIIWLSDAIDRE